MDQRFGGGYVGSYGDVVDIAESEKVNILGLAGFSRDRVSEKQKYIYFIAGDAGCDLLAAALRTADVSRSPQTCGFSHPFHCRSRGRKGWVPA